MHIIPACVSPVFPPEMASHREDEAELDAGREMKWNDQKRCPHTFYIKPSDSGQNSDLHRAHAHTRMACFICSCERELCLASVLLMHKITNPHQGPIPHFPLGYEHYLPL